MAKHSSDEHWTGKNGRKGTGKGRQSTARNKAREEGDLETFRALQPPSERPPSDDERCGARTQTPGNPPCRQLKGARTDHLGYGNCSKHGGNTEAGIKTAMREMGSDFIEQYKEIHSKFGGDRTDPSIANLTPESALLEEVRRSAAMVRFLEERIGAWTLGPATQEAIDALFRKGIAITKPQPVTSASLTRDVKAALQTLDEESKDNPAYLPRLTDRHATTGIVSFTDAREWLHLYREERGHLARVSKMCIDAGVAQRMVTLAEDQGRILSSAIRAVLQALSLTPQQQDLIPMIVPPILRAVANDQPIPDISSLAGTIEA